MILNLWICFFGEKLGEYQLIYLFQASNSRKIQDWQDRPLGFSLPLQKHTHFSHNLHYRLQGWSLVGKQPLSNHFREGFRKGSRRRSEKLTQHLSTAKIPPEETIRHKKTSSTVPTTPFFWAGRKHACRT